MAFFCELAAGAIATLLPLNTPVAAVGALFGFSAKRLLLNRVLVLTRECSPPIAATGKNRNTESLQKLITEHAPVAAVGALFGFSAKRLLFNGVTVLPRKCSPPIAATGIIFSETPGLSDDAHPRHAGNNCQIIPRYPARAGCWFLRAAPAGFSAASFFAPPPFLSGLLR